MRFLLVALLATTAAQGEPSAADRIVGRWVTPNQESKIEIVKCGDGYCGSIQWMMNPKQDANNPDPSLRTRPLVGVQIMRGFRHAGADTWDGGTLYGPQRGKEVPAKLVLAGTDALDIKVSAGVVRKTVRWTRDK